MKLALLTDGIFPFVIGGMQKHSFYLCKFLVKLGVEVTLVHCVSKGEPVEESEVRKELGIGDVPNFRSICLNFPPAAWYPGHYLKESFLYSTMIYKELEDEWDSFDFIYGKGFSAWALIDRKKKGKSFPPIGVKFHGYEMFQPTPSFKIKLQYMLLRGPVTFNNQNADYVFSYGGKITELVKSLGIDEDRIIEIPTGIEQGWLSSSTRTAVHGPRRFLFLGRYERRKGIEELNAVLQKLPADASFEFGFIGPIPASKKIKDPRITYHGKVMDQEKLQGLMDEADVLVTPSHSEGMPNVIMEGMARGLAVIATDVGAVPLQVDESNGWLIQPTNETELLNALEDALVCPDETLLAKQNKSMLKVKEQFTWEKVAQTTFENLQELSRRNAG